MTDHPLRLSVGSHSAGSGKGCAMNVISWENGDTTITDYPACSDQMLARIVQRVNDSICTHRDGDLLCPDCSQIALRLAHRTGGTGGVLSGVELYRAWVKVAVDLARRVQHLNTDPRVRAAIDAAAAWAENPTAYAACAAYAAASAAANAAANAACAAYAAASAAACAAYAAYAAASAAANAAANAACAAYAAAYAAANAATYAADFQVEMADLAVTRFREYAGLPADPPAPAPEVTASAVERMLATA